MMGCRIRACEKEKKVRTKNKLNLTFPGHIRTCRVVEKVLNNNRQVFRVELVAQVEGDGEIGAAKDEEGWEGKGTSDRTHSINYLASKIGQRLVALRRRFPEDNCVKPAFVCGRAPFVIPVTRRSRETSTRLLEIGRRK